jgi:hypothetical protein
MLLATLRLEGSRAAVGDYLRLYQKNWNHALVVKAVEEITQHKRLARKILLVGIFHRCRYLRQELLGRTVHELRMWEDPADRQFLPAQLQRGGPIRNVITLCSRESRCDLTLQCLQADIHGAARREYLALVSGNWLATHADGCLGAAAACCRNPECLAPSSHEVVPDCNG